MDRMHGKRAERHGHVDDEIDDHAARALRRPGGEPDQHVADVADGRVGHQPLDVGLADGREGPEAHGGDGERAHHLLPLRADAAEGTERDAHQQRDRGGLGRGREESRDRRRRALVDVGRPHVEGHRRDLEGDADEQEHEAEDQADVLRRPRRLGHRGDRGKARRAGEAVDEGGAVEQHARRQRAQQEVLEARLAGAQIVPADRRHHVERQALQLEAEVQRDEIVGRDHHHHAGRRQQHQHRVFEPLRLDLAHVVERQEQRAGGGDQRQRLHEAGEAIDDEAAVEQRLPPGRHADHQPRRQPQHGDGEPADALGLAGRSRAGTRRASAAPWRPRPERSRA